MADTRDVGVLVGSLRKDSLTRKLANAVIRKAAAPLKLSIVEIGELPLYNSDLEENVPPAWAAFRQRIAKCDAVLFFTPEYNRSVPGSLKNAIDVGSRPYGANVWEGKPAGVVSVSPGALGAFGANHHLRQALVFLDMPALQAPEAYIGGVGEMFDDQGNITKESTQKFLGEFMNAFAAWVETTRRQ